MRVLIMADEIFARRERAMLQRLEVGLADDGVRVIHAVPSSLPTGLPGTGEEVWSEAVAFEAGGVAFTRGLRADEIVRELRARHPGDEPAADVVHVFGGSLWHLGSLVARRLGTPIAFDVWRAGLIERAKAQLPGRRGSNVRLFCPDINIHRELTSLGQHVSLTPWGVYAPSTQPPVRHSDGAVSVVMAGTGHDAGAWQAAITALAEIAKGGAPIQVFADDVGARRAGVWTLAKRLGLLERFSLINALDGDRGPLLSCDLLLLPDALGEQATMPLEAMARGMPIVASTDPMVSWLVNNVTARLVDGADARSWREAIATLIEQPDAVASLTASAHAYVREKHRAAAHVAAVLRAYQTMANSSAVTDATRPITPA